MRGGFAEKILEIVHIYMYQTPCAFVEAWKDMIELRKSVDAENKKSSQLDP